MPPGLNEVRRFWEENPLWAGESAFPVGSKEFFEEHRRVCIEDCFAGAIEEGIFPDAEHAGRVLDLGCGPGFLTVELGLRGSGFLVGADLTRRAVELARTRCGIYAVDGAFAQANAEALAFADGAFSHVNCQGVIHHTPDTAGALAEIGRVLERGGSAYISVYYRNVILRAWPFLGILGRMLYRLGGKLSGRGREDIFVTRDADDLVRRYDGEANPIGKCYSKKEFLALLAPCFDVDEVGHHFFPARSMPFRLPRFPHRWLNKRLPFLIFAVARKR